MRKYEYVIQDNWNGEGWTDHSVGLGRNRINVLRELLKNRREDPIWHGNNGERKWRMIRRCVTETEVE